MSQAPTRGLPRLTEEQLRTLLMTEEVRKQTNTVIDHCTQKCWTLCYSKSRKVSNPLSISERECFNYCTKRYFDATKIINKRTTENFLAAEQKRDFIQVQYAENPDEKKDIW
eukprot:TRINITY_DN851_c0_g1_i2.p1 TRINITY_DN851_c0_g1~~TRINITY_DN851_c0_g1_i2.p1  ORF type:complete len:112 (+),score=22.26 TRINITY_DN851_c0_g1_i2:124-459(+)